jgi:hypothetical protein
LFIKAFIVDFPNPLVVPVTTAIFLVAGMALEPVGLDANRDAIWSWLLLVIIDRVPVFCTLNAHAHASITSSNARSVFIFEKSFSVSHSISYESVNRHLNDVTRCLQLSQFLRSHNLRLFDFPTEKSSTRNRIARSAEHPLITLLSRDFATLLCLHLCSWVAMVKETSLSSCQPSFSMSMGAKAGQEMFIGI